ncbi:MAG: DUF202 domain-containing protein [Candidatus Aenigmatarchaeota archaeon]
MAKSKMKRKARKGQRKRRIEKCLSAEEKRTLLLKEQTILSKERTILSFMRTGLTFVTVGFAMFAAGPWLSQGFNVSPWVSIIIGVSVAFVGFFEIVESFRRLKIYKNKMREITERLGEENV